MQKEEHDSTSAARPTLWKRAPWWRAAFIGAAVLTVAAIAFRAAQESLNTPPKNPQAASSSVSSSDEEEQTLAACRPHLIGNPNALPQIDIRNAARPDLGHIKIHMWVNGAGVVSRDIITDASFGTPVEQQAEMDYAKQLTFSLPNTKECRNREIEVIGDVVETRDASGRWATYVKLHPKLFFNNAGVLQHAD